MPLETSPVPAGLIRYGAAGARRRLYCMPFAGGGPSTYRLWPRSLPDDVEVVVVMVPGRDPRTRAASGAVPRCPGPVSRSGWPMPCP